MNRKCWLSTRLLRSIAAAGSAWDWGLRGHHNLFRHRTTLPRSCRSTAPALGQHDQRSQAQSHGQDRRDRTRMTSADHPRPG